MHMDLLDRYPLKGERIDVVQDLLGAANDVDKERSVYTWYLDLGWTALFHLDVHVNPANSVVDSVRVYD